MFPLQRITSIRGDRHMTSMKIVQFSRPHHHLLCPSTSKILPPPWPWTSNFKQSRLSPSDNQSIWKTIIQGWLLYVIRSFLQVGFRFKYQLINVVWLFFDFISSEWSLTIWFVVPLYSCVCSCPKISRNVFYL